LKAENGKLKAGSRELRELMVIGYWAGLKAILEPRKSLNSTKKLIPSFVFSIRVISRPLVLRSLGVVGFAVSKLFFPNTM